MCEHRHADLGPALLFFAPGVARRVRHYPENWYELADETLYAVSWTS